MSRKPTIKISYPDASDVAMKLTEAMVRRAPGRRVVETTSEDSASPAGGELFADFDACSTSASMDYALETLIRPNLTTDERKRILGEDAEQTELALTPSEQEKQIDVGKIPDRDLRTILADLVDAAQGYVQGGPDAWEKHIENAIETAIKEIDHRAGVIDLDETQSGEQEKTETAINITCMLAALLDCISRKKAKSLDGERELCTSIVNHIHGLKQDFCFSANEIAGIMEISAKLWFENDYKCPGGAPIFLSNMLYRTIRHDAADKYNKTCNDCDHFDPVDGICEIDKQEKDFLSPACDNFTPETDTAKESQSGEIDSGLFNDLDDGKEGEK